MPPPTPAELWRDYGWAIAERVHRAFGDDLDSESVRSVCAHVICHVALNESYDWQEPWVLPIAMLREATDTACSDLKSEGIDPRTLPHRDPAVLPAGIAAIVEARIRAAAERVADQEYMGEASFRGAMARAGLALRRRWWALACWPRRVREGAESRLRSLNAANLAPGASNCTAGLAPALHEVAAVAAAVVAFAGWAADLPSESAPPDVASEAVTVAVGSEVGAQPGAATLQPEHAEPPALRRPAPDGARSPSPPDNGTVVVDALDAPAPSPAVTASAQATGSEPVERTERDEGTRTSTGASVSADVVAGEDDKIGARPEVGIDCPSPDERGLVTGVACPLFDDEARTDVTVAP